jgi:hypothetical protein
MPLYFGRKTKPIVADEAKRRAANHELREFVRREREKEAGRATPEDKARIRATLDKNNERIERAKRVDVTYHCPVCDTNYLAPRVPDYPTDATIPDRPHDYHTIQAKRHYHIRKAAQEGL